MAHTLILMRHGNAEKAQEGQTDQERTLTSQGLAALRSPSGAARTFSLLSQHERETAALWASPAARAIQTAQTVAEAIGERPIITCDELWEQDPTAFMEKVRASDASTIIAVGHVPFVNGLTAALTSVKLKFKPGAAAAIALGDTNEADPKKLLWFVQAAR